MRIHPLLHVVRLQRSLLLGALLAPLAGAQSLETFVLAVGGNSSGTGCGTFGSPSPVSSVFGSNGIGVPLPGLTACGLAGDQRWTVAPGGPLQDGMSITTSWSEGTSVLDGSTAASARYGLLSADALSIYSGGTSSLTVDGTEGLARCDDRVTITSPTLAAGQPGKLRLTVHVQGALSCSGVGIADLELAYGIGTDFPHNLFRAQAYGSSAAPFVATTAGSAPAGFTLAPGSVSGADTVQTLPSAFVFGTTFDLRLVLLAYSLPILSSTTTAQLQARVTRVEVFDASNQPVTDFVLASASGSTYGASARRHWILVGRPLPAPLPPVLLPVPRP